MTKLKDQIVGKMQAEKIKNFSNQEIERVFKDCVARNKLIKGTKELIKNGNLTMKDLNDYSY